MLPAILVLAALLLAAVYLVRLGRIVRADPPTAIPRSHPDQVNPAHWVFARQ
jgi:hypothetical protein